MCIAMMGHWKLLNEEIQLAAAIRSLNLLQDRPSSIAVSAVQFNEDLQLNLINESKERRLHHGWIADRMSDFRN